jgi:hypothetical protein
MQIAKRYIGEVQQMVKRWEQQISKRRDVARATAPAAPAGEAQVNAGEPIPAASPESRGTSAPYSP